jgi:uncharacterized lipoprotein YmbA
MRGEAPDRGGPGGSAQRVETPVASRHRRTGAPGGERTLQEFSGAARSVRVLADYLERHPDAVLALSEFDRWAEPLQDNVLHVLAENLACLVPTEQVLRQAWPRSATLDYQVTVDMLQFDGWLGGESMLLALWSVLDGAELPLLSQRAFCNVPVGWGDYDAMVAAMSELLARLSRDIAVAIQRLASRVVAHE